MRRDGGARGNEHPAGGRGAVWRSWAAVGAVLLTLAMLPESARATAPNAAAAGATTSREARDESARAIPFAELDEPLRGKVRAVVAQPTIFRRMPAQTIDCDPDLYQFLVQYPEIVVNVWQLMGITNVTIQRRTADTYEANDGGGTTSRVELIHRARHLHIVYAEGTYDGPLVPRPITGRCVLVLHSSYASRDGRTRINSQLDAFVQLDQPAAELIAKTLHPIMGRTADRNFIESADFVGQIARASERNGPGVQQLASRLDQVHPRLREQFSDLALSVYHRAVLREAFARQERLAAERPTQAQIESSEADVLRRLRATPVKVETDAASPNRGFR